LVPALPVVPAAPPSADSGETEPQAANSSPIVRTTETRMRAGDFIVLLGTAIFAPARRSGDRRTHPARHAAQASAQATDIFE
jgi:hypothetical protein